MTNPSKTSPVADLVVSGSLEAGKPVVLDGSGSAAPTGNIRRFIFDPGDGSSPITSATPQVVHTYSDPGTYVPTLVVYDNRGNFASDSEPVEIVPPPVIPIDCVLGDMRVVSVGPWSECVNGMRSREEAWVRDILVHPENGGAVCGQTEGSRTVYEDCTVEPEDPEDPQNPEEEPSPGKYPYYEKLVADSARKYAYHFRTQASIDSIPSRAEGSAKIPVRYDSTQDAALFEIDPSGSLPNSGATGTPQKRMPVNVKGLDQTVYLTWDFKIAESMRWSSRTEPRVIDGKSVIVSYLDQHKSHRFDTPGADPWIGLKQRYKGNASGPIANYFFTASPSHMGPGTMRGASETICKIGADGKPIPQPVFLVQPDKWTRLHALLEGNFGEGDFLVKVNIWISDEDRDPVKILDDIMMKTMEIDDGVEKPFGFGLFRFEFDSSLKIALNGPGQQWQRNYAVLVGIDKQSVIDNLLVKP